MALLEYGRKEEKRVIWEISLSVETIRDEGCFEGRTETTGERAIDHE